jgi:hypothetical protein
MEDGVEDALRQCKLIMMETLNGAAGLVQLYYGSAGALVQIHNPQSIAISWPSTLMYHHFVQERVPGLELQGELHRKETACYRTSSLRRWPRRSTRRSGG